MGDDDLKPDDGAAAEDEPPAIVVPSHAPLPPPPEISFTRPTLKTGLGKTPPPSEGDQGEGGGHTVHLGLGLAATASFAGAVWAGAYLGEEIDKHWNHTGTPWGTIIMALAGLVAGFYNMYRLLIRPTGKK
jgi:hypothetical protein